MKRIVVLTITLLVITLGCTKRKSECIEKIKAHLKDNAMGIELNYKNVEFKWVDTLTVKERLSFITQDFSDRINQLTESEFYASDNYRRGKLFSIDYLTKERITELRNWEKRNRGIPFNDEYNDYYQFAFKNENASGWITRLCRQIEETDSLLAIYDNLTEGNWDLIKNMFWYYRRIEQYNTDDNLSNTWIKISNEMEYLENIRKEADSLSTQNPENIIHYKAFNVYTIKNPLLNGAEQEIKKYFLFNSQFDFIGKEDVKI